MKNLMTYRALLERNNSAGIPGKVEPVEFLTNLGFQEQEIEIIARWMAENRGDINLHYFPFRSSQPIAGVFIGDRDVAINSKMRMPKEMLLFLALHESKHSDQYMDGDFESMYFDPVIAGDRDLFIRGYNELEKEANDYALAAMVDLGFSRFVETQERQLRSNELAGGMVYDMMREDIKKTGATNFQELIRAQVL